MPSKLAVQMYTIRDYTKTRSDLTASLKKVREIGYTAVQLSAVGCMNGENPDVTATEAKKMLDDAGLACVATHRSLTSFINDPQAEIDFHRALDCDFAAIGGVPHEYFADEAGVRKFISEASEFMPKLKTAGIRFGYHNHAHEFVTVGPHREKWIDILIRDGGDLLNMEFDVYWVAHAGANPAVYMDKSKGRVPVIHFKDKEVVEKDGPVMAPVGEGNLDWDGLIPVCEASGVEWYCVEQDVCRRDPFDCLKSSFNFLKSKGL